MTKRIIIVILLGIVITSAFGLYHIRRNQNTEIIEQSPKQGVLDCKTYSTPELGFSVNYPKDYILLDNPTTFPSDEFKGAALVLQKKGQNGGIGDTLVFKKIRNTLKNEAAKRLTPHLSEMRWVNIGQENTLVFNYRTMSSDTSNVYLFPYDSSLGEDKVVDILEVTANAGVTNPEQPSTTLLDILSNIKLMRAQ